MSLTSTPMDIEFTLSERVARTVEHLWQADDLNDTSFHDPSRQTRLRENCAHKLGDDWSALQDHLERALSAPPFAAILRTPTTASAQPLLAAVAVSLGEAVNPYRPLHPSVEIFQEIKPAGTTSPDQVWHWHTDSANWRA